MPTLVSACLLGVPCRFDGRDSLRCELEEYCRTHDVIPVCPEQLGGLPTPRKPAEIVGGDGNDVLDGKARVLDCDGTDATEEYLRGARATLRLAELLGADRAVLKARSPSCASNQIYDGSHKGRLAVGMGVTAALLRRHGITVVSEEDWTAARQQTRAERCEP